METFIEKIVTKIPLFYMGADVMNLDEAEETTLIYADKFEFFNAELSSCSKFYRPISKIGNLKPKSK